ASPISAATRLTLDTPTRTVFRAVVGGAEDHWPMTVVDEQARLAEAHARRRSILTASAITNAILAVELLRAWWQDATGVGDRLAGLGIAVLLILGPLILLSLIVERSGIGEFPLPAWFLAGATTLGSG